MLTAGASALMRRMPSMPSMPGRPISSRMTSGGGPAASSVSASSQEEQAWPELMSGRFGGELDGVRDEVQNDLAQTAAVAAQLGRKLLRDLELQREPLGLRFVARRGTRLLERVAHVEVGDVQLELAGLDPREVEDIVDHRHHLLPGAGDLLGV